VKDQDFAIGKSLHFKFSPTPTFDAAKTTQGRLYLAVVAAECKINYDKTMFQECAGTASRLKQGSPLAKYYALVEYLDMEPEDCRLTEIDNVYLLRHAKRLPFEEEEQASRSQSTTQKLSNRQRGDLAIHGRTSKLHCGCLV